MVEHVCHRGTQVDNSDTGNKFKNRFTFIYTLQTKAGKNREEVKSGCRQQSIAVRQQIPKKEKSKSKQ